MSPASVTTSTLGPDQAERPPKAESAADRPAHAAPTDNEINSTSDSATNGDDAVLVRHELFVPSTARRAKRKDFGWLARRYNADLFGDKSRIGKCARYLTANQVAVKRHTDGGVHTSGLQQCGSIHACPPCAAKIRAQRACDIEQACKAHLKTGGGLAFLTVTLPHTLGDTLTELWDAVTKAWSTVIGGSPFHGTKPKPGTKGKTGAKATFGITGFMRAFDLTHGASGWHPHLHILVFTDRRITECDDEFWQLKNWFRRRWTARINKLTGRDVSQEFGIRLDSVKDDKGIGQYVSKVNHELARGDLKSARTDTSRTPFQILADAVLDGDTESRELWVDYVEASHGRQLITTSVAIKRRYLTDEKTDEDIANAEQEGTVEAFITADLWRRMRNRRDNLTGAFLAEQQRHGLHTSLHVLRRLGPIKLVDRPGSHIPVIDLA